MSKAIYQSSSGNVFGDIGVPNSDETSGQGATRHELDTIMKKRRMKQTEAAALPGIRQPDVSKMLRGEFRQLSVERLLHLLVKMDQDVEIIVRPHRSKERAPALRVA